MNKRNVLTCTGGGGRLLTAFTMAEILLSLTIIGVVAAITLPSLTGNINERTWNTQRKALYARFSQAIALMPALNGYGTVADDDENNVAEVFVSNGLSKVLKINNVCSSENLKDCGLASQITDLNGSKIEFPAKLGDLNSANISVDALEGQAGNSHIVFNLLNSKAAAFETANGESIAVYYNPTCESYLQEPYYTYMQKKLCVNFIYDLNGIKGPNTVGKDIGIISAFYPTDSVVVAPVPYIRDAENVPLNEVSSSCTRLDNDYRLPSLEEISSVAINLNVMGELPAQRYWTSSYNAAGQRIYLHYTYLRTAAAGNNSTSEVRIRCVKR